MTNRKVLLERRDVVHLYGDCSASRAIYLIFELKLVASNAVVVADANDILGQGRVGPDDGASAEVFAVGFDEVHASKLVVSVRCQVTVNQVSGFIEE